jgi:two-component system nitrogen regulation response regulator GlnG
LLRAIENRKLQPVGGKIRDIDVRLLAATDYDLEQAVEYGAFRRPLFQRLSGFQIKVPPLRERRDDIGRLFVSFLARELEIIGQLDRLKEQPPGQSWIPAKLVAEFARYRWPGNVRQLQNLTRQLVISNRDSRKLDADPILTDLLRNVTDSQNRADIPSQPPKKKRRTNELTEPEIIGVLRQHRFNLNASASELGISRNWLNHFIEHCPSLRQAKDVEAAEIRQCAIECDNDINKMAARLEVSSRGLKLQIKRLGL